MRHSIIRLACSLAGVCGVSLRHIAVIFSALFLIPMTKSSLKRWIDDIGATWPSKEERLQQLLAITPATECHIDGYYPRGTDHWVMVVKDEQDRLLMTHEVDSENGADARQFLQTLKDGGRKVTAAFADYSHSFTEAIQAVYPQARFQAWNWPRQCGSCGGASSRNPAIYLRRSSRPLPRWKEWRRGVSPVSAA
jgi:hypothetical protein